MESRPSEAAGAGEPAPGGDRRSLIEAAIQALPVGLVIQDEHGACILVNAAARRLEGDDFFDGGIAPGRRPPGRPPLREVESCVCELSVEDETYRLTTLIDVTRHHDVERELLQRAYIDSLTGLPNRSLIEQSVEDLIRTAVLADRFALAFIDVDNFKHINDFYSHAVGDALLTKIAARLGGALQPGDMLARVGGDEFVLLLNPALDPDATRGLVTEMSEALKQPFFIDDHEIFASASIGLCFFPEHGRDYDTLRRNADNAMYRVKGGVKGGVRIFEDTMSRAATARMAVEQRLRLAIRDHSFRCAYQPKVDVRSGQVHGVEVLLRWRDEAGVIQAPGDFIGLAIELGLINDITREVLAETEASIADIDELFGPDVSISINIAAKQACDVPFMTSFVSLLSQNGNARRYVIELTEEAFFTKNQFQRSILPMVREAGAKVSIDDFGVGYSSLAALAEITADELKIDRSFVTNIHQRPRTQVVLKAIESLGRSLGMSIVAEGVETFEEVAYLQAATEIRLAQGYYFGRPMLIDQLKGLDGAAAPRNALQHRHPVPLRRHQAARA